MEWENLQPTDIWGLEEAAQWRRSREWEPLAIAVFWIVRTQPGGGEVRFDDILASLPGYEESATEEGSEE